MGNETDKTKTTTTRKKIEPSTKELVNKRNVAKNNKNENALNKEDSEEKRSKFFAKNNESEDDDEDKDAEKTEKTEEKNKKTNLNETENVNVAILSTLQKMTAILEENNENT